MKKFSFIFLTLIGITFSSCNSAIKTQNTVGVWENVSVRKDGWGVSIVYKTELEIIRHGAGDYSYKKTTTENGNTSRSSGKIDERIIDREWRFVSGSYADLDAYVKMPIDKWDDYKPSSLIIGYDSVVLEDKVFLPVN
jgi:hypothetical protein|tara:strand:- start:165 stop:578 length:414 start_codon:yes stop_codon:yes gene_type:complete